MLAVLGAILLLPASGRTQEQPAKPAQPGTQAEQEAPPSEQENMPEAPIEPVMSGAFPVMSQQVEARGRQVFEMFNHGESSQMWASLSEGLRKRSGKEERFSEINKKIRERMGTETQMLQETIVPYIMAPDTVYSRLSNFSNVRVPVISTITLNQRGQIDGFNINFQPTVAEGRYAGYQGTAKLRLPFNGEWLVYQGGRSPFENGYAVSDDQRFGVDFVYLKDGRLFSGTGGYGSKDEDYFCFGQPVLAPGDGKVIRAESGYDDNPPGKPSGDPPDGNLVVISHGNGESSLMNHLKQNSLKVKLGDTVKQGDVIAACGNSGVGPVPHVHYQLQRTTGVPLPAQFVDYIADGKPVASGEPLKGQLVQNGAPPAAATSGPPPAEAGASAPASEKAGSAGTTPPAKPNP